MSLCFLQGAHSRKLTLICRHRSTLAENMDKKESDVFEEVGIDTDEAVGADFKKLDGLYGTVRINLNKEAAKRRRMH